MNTLFDRIGGAETVSKAVEILYDKLLNDERLSPYFAKADVRKLKTKKRPMI